MQVSERAQDSVSFKWRELTPQCLKKARDKKTVEVTKALAALRPLYGKDNVEIITTDGQRIRGIVRSMKMTQALTTPSVKMERADGEIIKIPFTNISEIIDHNERQNPEFRIQNPE